MIYVYMPDDHNPLLNSSHAHGLPFEIEKEVFRPTNNINKANIIPVLGGSSVNINEQWDYIKNGYNNQLILVLNLFHIDDGSDIDIVHTSQINRWKAYVNKVALVHTNVKEKNNIFYDFLWNRQKAYFTEYKNFNLTGRVWSWGAQQEMYALEDISKLDKPKHYIAANRIYHSAPTHPRTVIRKRLKNVLQPHYRKGFVSDPENKVILDSNQQGYFQKQLLKGEGGTWWPVANHYYRSSYVSIYVETITTSNLTNSITEKTWDPLIKGHFILPYSYSGIIKDLKNIGFKFPNWLDYSYDEESDETRLSKYIDSVHDFLKISKKELKLLYKKDKHILEHNRNLFFTRDYDSLYKKIKNYV